MQARISTAFLCCVNSNLTVSQTPAYTLAKIFAICEVIYHSVADNDGAEVGIAEGVTYSVKQIQYKYFYLFRAFKRHFHSVDPFCVVGTVADCQ